MGGQTSQASAQKNLPDPGPTPLALGGKLASMSLPRQVLALALWPFLENLMGVGVGFVDMMIAGRMEKGEASLAIMDMVGVSMYLVWLLMILQAAMGTGALALVSRLTGARDMPKANLALGQALVLGVISGALSGLLLWLMVPVMAQFFGLSAGATAYLTDYMRIIALQAPFTGILFVAASSLRGYGDALRPFLAMILVNAVNVALSLYFVYELDWGVRGLAAGTVIGWIAGAFFILWFLRPNSKASKKAHRHGGALVLRLQNLRYDIPMLRRIWRVSWPSMIEILGMWSIHGVGLHLIGGYSEGTLGAHAMVVRLESVSFMPGFAIGIAASALTGQYLGAGDKLMAIKAVRFCWMVAVITMSTTGLLLSIFNHEFLSIFMPSGSPQHELAAPVIRFVGLFQALMATMIVMKMSMRGAGATRVVTIYSFAIMGTIRLAALWVAVRFFHVSLVGIWCVMMADVLVQAAVFSHLHFKGKWLHTQV